MLVNDVSVPFVLLYTVSQAHWDNSDAFDSSYASVHIIYIILSIDIRLLQYEPNNPFLDIMIFFISLCWRFSGISYVYKSLNYYLFVQASPHHESHAGW